MRYMKWLLFITLLCSSVIQANEFNGWLNAKLANIALEKVGAQEIAEYRKIFDEIKNQEAQHEEIKGRCNHSSGFEEHFTLADDDTKAIFFSAQNQERLKELRSKIFTKWTIELTANGNILTDDACGFAKDVLKTNSMMVIHNENVARAAMQLKIIFGVCAGVIIMSGIVAKIIKAKKGKKAVQKA